MAFRIVIGPAALRDLDEMSLHVAQDSGSERAGRWCQGALNAIRGLVESPKGFAIVPEAEGLGIEYRQIHYYAHRIVFEIDEAAQVVLVARVYHGARRALKASDLP